MPNPNLKAGPGRPKGLKNRVSRDMATTVLQVWDTLQGDGPEAKGKSLLDQAIIDPKWFYDFCKGMLPKDIFVGGDIKLTQMSPQELDDKLRELVEIACESEDSSNTDS